jgi:hypothetical protein
MKDYSTKQISKKLVEEVIKALQNIRGWGSVEIFVQDSEVVQIVERNIKKTIGIHDSASSKKTTVSTAKTGA